MGKMLHIYKFVILSLSLQAMLSAVSIHSFSNFTGGFDGWQPANPWELSTEEGMDAGDAYLRMPVGFGGNRGSKLIAFNSTEAWTGNFNEKSIVQVRLNFRNWSETDEVYLRLAISNLANPQQSGGTWWVSESYEYFAPNSGWGSAIFDISANAMRRIGNIEGELGTDSFSDTLEGIQGFRILSSTLGYSATGDEFYGVVGMDNIELIAIPELNLGSMKMLWGMLFLLVFFHKVHFKLRHRRVVQLVEQRSPKP